MELSRSKVAISICISLLYTTQNIALSSLKGFIDHVKYYKNYSETRDILILV